MEAKMWKNLETKDVGDRWRDGTELKGGWKSKNEEEENDKVEVAS